MSIGRYCSIGDDVLILDGGEHFTDRATTYPFPHFCGGIDKPDGRSKGPIVIGNDVWIGNRAIILSGVTIGDGAVIGAGSVVTRDIAPYSIAAGNPARHIRYRFDARTRSRLLASEWWMLPKHEIVRLLPLLLGTDIDALLRELGV